MSLQLDRQLADPQVFINDREVLITLRDPKQMNQVSANNHLNSRRAWLIDRIVIDPGHGGKHPGAVSRSGVKEKELTLDIAKRMKRLLEKNKVEVLLTRERDQFMGLSERTQFANKKGGKLFVSIHINGSVNRKERGFSVWVLGKGKTEKALEIARKENSVIEFEDSQDQYKEMQEASYILNAIAQSSYLKESLDLASLVNQSMKKRTKLPQYGNGVYQAGFYVLVGASMPRVLVEVAFLSNQYDERYIRERANRQKIAAALCESIMMYKEKYEAGIQ
jgi:N-acetylmuramoyl-L-alanine amidase